MTTMTPLDVPCPICGAEAHHRCVSKSGQQTSHHEDRIRDAREAERTQAREYDKSQDALHDWSTRFPLTLADVQEDIRTVPSGRAVHLARIAERWGIHPSIASFLVDALCRNNVSVIRLWDVNDTCDGLFPDEVSRWWG